ncbi:carbohydrate ABC transporter substrate-binding protein, CUT1 family [Paenibacillaceae bacterium GAS479]|nr:carbohydrate ABC transporter substrate-binding protein, CUT1 family [Paenibacillaceae bacterium GAS479]
MRKKWARLVAVPLVVASLLAGCSNAGNDKPAASGEPSAKPADKPATWIADRKIKGLIFMDSDDQTSEMNPEIIAKIKEMTGIDYEVEVMKANKAIEGLTAGIASGNLPDFIAFYLNNSGRQEMPVILKAAREGMFTDLTPLLKDTKVYSKYLTEGYLPNDTNYGVMFRPEFNGSSYFVHMNVNREGGYTTNKYVGGPYIRKDIAEALNVDPSSIKTTEQLYELAKKIKDGKFKDNNGSPVVPIGPSYWGGKEVGQMFSDLQWGDTDQWIYQGKDGKILHEAQTPVVMKKVEFMQKLLKEKLIHPEFFTIDQPRAEEGALNGSWAIIGDMQNYLDFNQDLHYLPIGPLNDVEGDPYQMQVDFKSGYAAWAVPSTTKNPEEIVKFADFLASREGKLLWKYGIEGRDYTLDEKGNPLVKQEVMDLKASNAAEARKLGFAGVGNNWGGILGQTDIADMEDFGEMAYGDRLRKGALTGKAAADYWKWDEKRAKATIVDAYTPKSFLNEFQTGTDLTAAFTKYKDSLVKAYYSDSPSKAQKIIDDVLKQMQAAGLDDYLKLLEQKNSDEKTKIKFKPSR